MDGDTRASILTLSRVLQHSTFEDFISEQYAEENLAFLREVRRFREAPSLELLEDIKEQFIEENAAQQINLSAELRNLCLQRTLSAEAFDSAELHIRNCLKMQLFPMYLQSHFNSLRKEEEELFPTQLFQEFCALCDPNASMWDGERYTSKGRGDIERWLHAIPEKRLINGLSRVLIDTADVSAIKKILMNRLDYDSQMISSKILKRVSQEFVIFYYIGEFGVHVRDFVVGRTYRQTTDGWVLLTRSVDMENAPEAPLGVVRGHVPLTGMRLRELPDGRSELMYLIVYNYGKFAFSVLPSVKDRMRDVLRCICNAVHAAEEVPGQDQGVMRGGAADTIEGANLLGRPEPSPQPNKSPRAGIFSRNPQ